MLYITYETTFDAEKVALGEEVPNTADLTFNNSFMVEDEKKESEKPEVHTGGINIFKYTIEGGSEKSLAGAEFRIAATEEDALAGKFLTDEAGNVITETSDENGIVTFSGLAYGRDGDKNDIAFNNYWVVETKSPEANGVKYNLLDAPVQIAINSTSHILPSGSDLTHSSYDVSILNRTGIRLPTTGGIGTILFTVLGILFMAVAAILFVQSSKTEKVKKIK